MHRRFIAFLPILVFALAPAGDTEADSADANPLAAEAQQYFDTIGKLRAEYWELTQQERTAEGDERAVAALQARGRLLEFMRVVEKLMANVSKQKEEGHEIVEVVKETRTLLWDLDRSIPRFLDSVESDAAALRASLSESPDDAETIREQIDRVEKIIDEVVRFYLAHVNHLESLELSSQRARSEAANRLTTRAGNLSGRLQLTRERLDKASVAHEAAASAESEAAVRDAQEALDRVASSLWTTCDLMEELGLSTAEHRQVLILATGEISTDVLDWDVIMGLAEDAGIAVQRWIERRGPTVVTRLGMFVGIMVAFWMLGRIARRSMERLINRGRENVNELASRILIGTVSRAVIGIGFFVALSQVGVNVTALITGLGIAGFIIGFALQETLGNFASGAMILMYRPYDVGDVIEAAGVLGKVDQMNLVSTTILTFDNQTLVVPNTRIWGNVIRNATHQRIRRVDLAFYLPYGSDLLRVEEILTAICGEHPSVLADPEPAIRVHELTEQAMVVVARPWVATDDYWPTYWDLNREAVIRLAEAGIQLGAPRLVFPPDGAD